MYSQLTRSAPFHFILFPTTEDSRSLRALCGIVGDHNLGLISIFRIEPSTFISFGKVRGNVEELAYQGADERGGCMWM